MITGIGIDVIEIGRIARAMGRGRFVRRILTEKERSIASHPTFVAGRWAAKEAVAKAVGRRLRWQDVEILSDESGAPFAALRIHRTDIIHISISHEGGIAAAVAVCEDGAR